MRNYFKFSGLIWAIALLTGLYAVASGKHDGRRFKRTTETQHSASTPAVSPLRPAINAAKFKTAPLPENPFLTTGISPSSGTINGGAQLRLNWGSTAGALEYDLEWTTLDSGSHYIHTVALMAAGTAGTVPAIVLDSLFLHNATRVTTADSSYLISLVSNDNFIVARLRPVHYTTTGIRLLGAWDYSKGSGQYAAWALTWHQQNLNWQYSAAFAEEGKKKEVVSYFDGSLRGRQTVTVNNSDNVAVVQENVYDEFGRATASILPAPFKDSSGVSAYLRYFNNYNLNSAGVPYNSVNVQGSGSAFCEFFPDTLPANTGASRYYSAKNPFRNPASANYARYNNYIPDAERYPLSVTQYTADNTGRIKIQGGVGKIFQPGSSSPSKTTKYFYGKPEQWELDQLFGNDAGYASHYLKNMVVDPNEQVSISYINASGKTVATALTGPAPASMDSLASSVPISNHTITLMDTGSFVFDRGNLNINATTTYLASVPGPAKIRYSVQKLIDKYPGGADSICSNCYYDLNIKVYDDCKDSIYSSTIPVGSLTPNCSALGTDSSAVNLTFPKIGEYYITFQLTFSKTIMENYVSNFVTQGQANGALQKQFDFVLPQLEALDLKSCLSDCSSNEQSLGTQAHFTQVVKSKLTLLGVDSASLVGTPFNTWITTEYASLKLYVDSTQANCNKSTYLSPCQQYQQPMLDDVSPGGQYALFDANNNAVDTINNAIYLNWRTVFPAKPKTDTLYKSNLITLADGTITSPYDSTFTYKLLVQYWQPGYANSFLVYHPEYCKLVFCQNNIVSESWDETVQDSIVNASQIGSIPGAPSGFHYDYTNGAWLLNADPFFQSGGLGASYLTAFQNDLLNYSKNVANNTVATTKDLVKFVDYLTYCADPSTNPAIDVQVNTYNNWDNCIPATSCRVPNREWSTYKEFYFQLKQQYYNKVRLATTCANKCTVGTPIVFPSVSSCPAVSDFVVNEYSSADGTPAVTCDTSKKIVTLAYTGGNVATRVTVTISYAAGTDTTGLAKTFVFTTGNANKMFCVPKNLPSQSITVQTATCDSCAINPLLYNSWQNDHIIQNIYSGGTIISTTTLHIDSQLYYRGLMTISPGNIYSVTGPLHTYSGSWQLDQNCQFALYSNNVKYTLSSVSSTSLALTHREGNIEEIWYYTGSGSAITCTSPDTLHVTALQGNNSYYKGAYPNRHLLTVIAGSPGTPPAFTCINSSGGSGTSTSVYHTCLSIYTPNATVKYQNVWVFDCVYDNVPSTCSPTLLTKEARFHDTFGQPVATDSVTASQQQKTSLISQTQSTCVANADNWMAALHNGFAGHGADTITLRNTMIAICEQGGDLNHPFGASTVPTGQTGPSGYNSFGAAIKGVLGITTFTTSLNPWLINTPYPYTPQEQGAYKNITTSTASICTILTTLMAANTAYNTSHGTSLTLYQYLVLIYGNAMIMSPTDLADLQNSCTSCKYLLNNQMTLPVFLDPSSKGCIVPGDYSTAKSDLTSQFGGSLDTANVNYQTIYQNFMNQRWGFTLSYDQYKAYDAQLVSNPSAVLCNQVISVAPPVDSLDCVGNQLAVGYANGAAAYDSYIAIQKDLFRNSYVSACSVAQTTVRLNAPQKVYHYTLYYYDQADNLVRTVPPEGVTLIDSTHFAHIDSARNSGDTSKALYPQHKIPTYYAYNSSNKVSLKQSPDGGTSLFWYDLLSRLNISRNDEQTLLNNYSYTKYDSLSRVDEVGQKNQTTVSIGTPDYLATTTINSFNTAGTNSQITNTYYDTVVNNTNGIQKVGQTNLAMRNRISVTTYRNSQTDTVMQATYYDYDFEGYIKNLYQQIQGLGIKRINYEYDLISGKVNFVAYQNGKADQFYYQYQYDADNRITQAWTSIKADTSTYGIGSKLDPAKQKLDATYQYYLHGPLARMELGDVTTKVQGVDYAYTLQGWIKGVNSQTLNASLDMGQDSATVAKDAYGYSLGYYPNDYKPIGGSTSYPAFVNQYTQNTGDITGQSLYNGNISTSTYAISAISSGVPVGYTYHYDQLNRLKKLRQHSSITSWNNGDINGGYSEDFTYDGNGNILSLLRSGTTSATKDSLLYQYNYSSGRLTNNKLNWLNGHGAATNMGTDQGANNYKYDLIGNLTDDAQARVDSIHWSVYGKIQDMLDSSKTITYKYNTAQERVTKTANGLTTYYVRDAQGNTLALYDNKVSQINWREQHLYGSSRLGMWQPNVNLATNNASTVWDTIGHKNYELSNHLGNVMVTITDARMSHTGFYTANTVTAQDYYAFGALMPGRSMNAANTRYGFNGKDNDNEVKGIGNQQDYGMRTYDPRIGKFLSIDPIAQAYPELTPYQFASNRPIDGIDMDGKEWQLPIISYEAGAALATLVAASSAYIITKQVIKHPTDYNTSFAKYLPRDFRTQQQNSQNRKLMEQVNNLERSIKRNMSEPDPDNKDDEDNAKILRNVKYGVGAVGVLTLLKLLDNNIDFFQSSTKNAQQRLKTDFEKVHNLEKIYDSQHRPLTMDEYRKETNLYSDISQLQEMITEYNAAIEVLKKTRKQEEAKENADKRIVAKRDHIPH